MQSYQPNIHYSKDLERAVLGICLLEKPPLKGVLSVLKPESLYVPGHRKVYEAIKDMATANLPVDILTVANYLLNVRHVKLIDNNEVGYFLTTLTRDVVSSAHVNYHCAIIVDMYYKRLSLAAEVEGRPAPAAPKPASRLYPYKIAKYLLRIADKELLKSTCKVYGNNTIKGRLPYTIRVESPQQAYLMHLIAPEYTWSCVEGDEKWTRKQIKEQIKNDCILKVLADGTRYWENKSGYPENW